MAKTIITLEEVELEVHYDFRPEEKPVMHYSDGSGDPGISEKLTINAIEHRGEDVTDLLWPSIEKIKDRVFNHIYNAPDED